MKKIIVLFVLILIIVFGVLYFATDMFKPTEMLNDKDTSKLANESYLDILVAMEDYDAVKIFKNINCLKLQCALLVN